MPDIKLVEERRSHGGAQRVYSHWSDACQCTMTFAIFLPQQALDGQSCPTLTYLSGLTCSHANVMEKGEYREAAAHHGIVFICPDTSPRGDDVPDDDVYYSGKGAGYYLNATQSPYAKNYNMERYIAEELPNLISEHFSASDLKDSIFGHSIFGHSMGGHGALTLALKHPNQYRSASAFAPICNPMNSPWGTHAFSQFLGTDHKSWRSSDAVALIEDGHHVEAILVDQGLGDEFLESQLKPGALKTACANAGISLTLQQHAEYDHSYYFISSFMKSHIEWHAERLTR